jgi:hypothetical protein
MPEDALKQAVVNVLRTICKKKPESGKEFREVIASHTPIVERNIFLQASVTDVLSAVNMQELLELEQILVKDS